MLGGKYRYSEVLGQHAAVELAYALDTSTGRTVALQRLPLTAARPDALQKCRERMLAVRALVHPHLLELLDCFEHDGALCLVSEAPGGESLRARLAREAVSVSQLGTWLADAMRAVSVLHRHGLVLGALTPAFIHVKSDAPAIKVAPLLLASLCASPVDDAQLGYCSVEQLAGAADLDARSDVYAFAAIAYEALSGALPFAADTPAATRLRVMTEMPTPLKRARPELPDELCTLLDLALTKRREQRLASLESMLALLEPCTAPLSERKVPLLTVQLTAASPHLRPAAPLASRPAARVELVAAESSLSPVDKPIHSAAPHAAAGAARSERRTMQRARLALGALAALLVAGWALSQHTAQSAPAAVSGARPPAAPVPEPAPPPEAHLAPDVAPAAAAGSEPAEPAEAPIPVDTATAKPARRRPLKSRQPAVPLAPSGRPPRSDCDPNYVFDTQGNKHWKPECF